jgi:hypothetical protein
VAHFFGCGFNLIAVYVHNNNPGTLTWVMDNGNLGAPWQVVYVDALYFAVITMITVGFGDICPTNPNEKIYVIILTVLSCGVFAYAVNTIGNIFSEISKKNAVIK